MVVERVSLKEEGMEMLVVRGKKEGGEMATARPGGERNHRRLFFCQRQEKKRGL